MLAEYRIGICKTQSLRAENRCAEGNMLIQTTDTQPPLFVPTVQTQDVLVHSELQSVQQLNLGHGQKAVKSQFKNIIYFANCSIYSNAKKPKKKTQTEAALSSSDYILFAASYSSCFFPRHRFIIMAAQPGRTQHAIVLAAHRHDDGGSVPLSWPS